MHRILLSLPLRVWISTPNWKQSLLNGAMKMQLQWMFKCLCQQCNATRSNKNPNTKVKRPKIPVRPPGHIFDSIDHSHCFLPPVYVYMVDRRLIKACRLIFSNVRWIKRRVHVLRFYDLAPGLSNTICFHLATLVRLLVLKLLDFTLDHAAHAVEPLLRKRIDWTSLLPCYYLSRKALKSGCSSGCFESLNYWRMPEVNLQIYSWSSIERYNMKFYTLCFLDADILQTESAREKNQTITRVLSPCSSPRYLYMDDKRVTKACDLISFQLSVNKPKDSCDSTAPARR